MRVEKSSYRSYYMSLGTANRWIAWVVRANHALGGEIKPMPIERQPGILDRSCDGVNSGTVVLIP